MTVQFENRVAAITGAGSGIGRALALELAARGAHLALSDVSASGLAGTVDRLVGTPVTVTTKVLDVADRTAVVDWADEVVREHGRVNLIVNNAGVALSGTVEGLPVDDYAWIMGINFWGVVHGTQAFLPHLRAAGEGHVVNLSSVFGLTAQPLMSGYNASKYAVRGFTESLRQELDLTGDGVSATCVHPGGIRTNVARAARRHASVADIAGPVDETAVSSFEKALRTSPEDAARAILRGAAANRRRVLIGPDARVIDLMARVAPAGYQLVTERVAARRRAPRAPRTPAGRHRLGAAARALLTSRS